MAQKLHPASCLLGVGRDGEPGACSSGNSQVMLSRRDRSASVMRLQEAYPSPWSMTRVPTAVIFNSMGQPNYRERVSRSSNPTQTDSTGR